MFVASERGARERASRDTGGGTGGTGRERVAAATEREQRGTGREGVRRRRSESRMIWRAVVRERWRQWRRGSSVVARRGMAAARIVLRTTRERAHAPDELAELIVM